MIYPLCGIGFGIEDCLLRNPDDKLPIFQFGVGIFIFIAKFIPIFGFLIYFAVFFYHIIKIFRFIARKIGIR
jgi:hypothetical protein